MRSDFKSETWNNINMVLGFNLEGHQNSDVEYQFSNSDGLGLIRVEHEFEEDPMLRIEGKKGTEQF